MSRSATEALLLLLLVLPLVAAGTTVAQEERIRPLERRVLGIGATVHDLDRRTRGLERRVEDLSGRTATVETADEITVRLSGDVLFDFDSAAIRADAVPALRELAEVIRAHPGARVRIAGHTDAKGSEAYNQRLSERRAQSVRDWLVREAGLAEVAFLVRGYGETRPVAPNTKPDGSDDPEGRQKNRRVEVVIEKR